MKEYLKSKLMSGTELSPRSREAWTEAFARFARGAPVLVAAGLQELQQVFDSGFVPVPLRQSVMHSIRPSSEPAQACQAEPLSPEKLDYIFKNFASAAAPSGEPGLTLQGNLSLSLCVCVPVLQLLRISNFLILLCRCLFLY